MSEIFVIGHRNPDTDAICSAIGYAEFKRRTGMPEAVAARCGDTNDRIDFVLNTFGVPAPRFVADVSPKVRDVMQRKILSVTPDATAAQALQLMDEHNIRILPVLDKERRCRGLLSLFKLSKFLFPAANRLVDSRRVLSSLTKLAETLHGELLVANEPDGEEDLMLMIGAMSLESFAERLETFPREKLVVVVGDRWDIQNVAIREGVRVLIVTGGLTIESQEMIDYAAKAQEGQSHFFAARHGHHGVALPRGRRGAACVERGVSLLPRAGAAGGGAGRGHIVGVSNFPRAGFSGRDGGHFVEDGFSQDGDAQVDSRGSQRTFAGRAGRGRSGDHRDH